MECTFYVGQKVVCIGSGFSHEIFGLKCPVTFETYTIRDLGTGPIGTVDGPEVVNCRLKEIVNPVCSFADGAMEAAFDVRAFIPATDQKTDISVFQNLLQPEPEKVK
jgi:hypothetical protein